jgi:hypothetical protein
MSALLARALWRRLAGTQRLLCRCCYRPGTGGINAAGGIELLVSSFGCFESAISNP